MENSAQNKPQKGPGNKSIVTGGIIAVIGIVWLMRVLNVNLPYWLFSWEMILIAIGLGIGINSRFQNATSYILILIGGVFLLDDFFYIPVNMMRIFWPALLILIGLVVIFRPGSKGGLLRRRKQGLKDEAGDSNTERLDLVSVFNGIKRSVTAKDFRGGETVTVFGGTELNLLQADIKDIAYLDCVAVFGGLKLMVPRNWEVRTEATSLFGGVDDKRVSAVEVVTENKVLVITGTVLFGGIDIVSY